jgi:SPFH domain / Band 7 family
VSIVVQFRVVDPKLALHAVEKYEDRLYSDVQLAARRSLASMTLEEILTNRNRLSEDILRDVKGTAATYGVTIQRADVKDLVFPGNLLEIMNKVVAAERMSQVQLVEARTKADVQKIETQSKAEAQKQEAEARAHAQRLAAEADAEVQRLQTEAEIKRLQERERNAPDYASKIHIVIAPAYYHNYMMGQLFASQVHHTIAREVLKTDPDHALYVRHKSVGRYMSKRVFAPGKTLPWNDLTRIATGEELNPKAFAEDFRGQ